ncbi:hypothetical protein AXG93_2752s1080 [Marchantia polymorpha subsp. ruderalis]|uniref:Uncharacterized protein n=1 Tax=Marchantia polymorpha subsp. ruderalis TaxID=1480154 RepID=A0A176VTG0_MARPO|nr:hypothetical protein AXG93_2752s1080 [Marchantia polymorpha subsp. ruderalis]
MATPYNGRDARMTEKVLDSNHLAQQQAAASLIADEFNAGESFIRMLHQTVYFDTEASDICVDLIVHQEIKFRSFEAVVVDMIEQEDFLPMSKSQETEPGHAHMDSQLMYGYSGPLMF